jgi:hypothetical protein
MAGSNPQNDGKNPQIEGRNPQFAGSHPSEWAFIHQPTHVCAFQCNQRASPHRLLSAGFTLRRLSLFRRTLPTFGDSFLGGATLDSSPPMNNPLNKAPISWPKPLARRLSDRVRGLTRLGDRLFLKRCHIQQNHLATNPKTHNPNTS